MAEIILVEGAAPSTPASGSTTIYVKADGLAYSKDDAGVETLLSGGQGITDGDKGDVNVSGGGVTWTIDNDVVTFAKMQNVSANSALARAAGTPGDLSEIALGASELLGRGESGNVAAITLGSGLTMTGTVLSSSGGSSTDYLGSQVFS